MFSKLNHQNEITSFEIYNKQNLKISLINGIRRTIVSDIPTYAIHKETINFIVNSGIFDNSYLTLRLGLIPIKSDLKNVNYDAVELEFHAKNETEYIQSYYCRDFTGDTQVFAYPETLFTKLKPNEELHLVCKLQKDNGVTNGGCFSPVCNASYKFKLDQKQIEEQSANMSAEEKQSFNTLEAKRLYLKNKDGQPSVYEMTLENCGNYDNKTIMSFGMDILKLKLIQLSDEIKHKNKDKFKISLGNNKFESYDIELYNENDTIGNLLTSYMLDDKNVKFCGYKIPHPLKKILIIRISLEKDNTMNNVLKLIHNTIEHLVKMIDTMKKEWKKL